LLLIVIVIAIVVVIIIIIIIIVFIIIVFYIVYLFCRTIPQVNLVPSDATPLQVYEMLVKTSEQLKIISDQLSRLKVAFLPPAQASKTKIVLEMQQKKKESVAEFYNRQSKMWSEAFLPVCHELRIFAFRKGLRREFEAFPNKWRDDTIEDVFELAKRAERRFKEGRGGGMRDMQEEARAWKGRAICFTCKKRGHIAPDCPDKYMEYVKRKAENN